MSDRPGQNNRTRWASHCWGWAWVLAVGVGVYACAPAAPDPPEAVVDKFVHLLGARQLAAAKALCTPAKQAYLDALASLAVEDSLALADTGAVVVLGITCHTVHDTAFCHTRERDAYEVADHTYRLLRQDGQWRVDHEAEAAGIIRQQATEAWPQDSL